MSQQPPANEQSHASQAAAGSSSSDPAPPQAHASYTPGAQMPAMPGGWAIPAYNGVNAMQAQAAFQAFVSSQMAAAAVAQAAQAGAEPGKMVAQNFPTAYPMMQSMPGAHLQAPDQALVPSISPNVSPDVPRANAAPGSPAAQVAMDASASGAAAQPSFMTTQESAQAALAAQAQAQAQAMGKFRGPTSVPVGAQRYRPSNVVPQVSPGMPRARANKPAKPLALDATSTVATADLLRSLSSNKSAGSRGSPASSPAGERAGASFMAIADAASRAREDSMDTSGPTVTALTARMSLNDAPPTGPESETEANLSHADVDTSNLSRRQLARINNNIASRKSRAKKKALFEALQAHSDEVEAKLKTVMGANLEISRERDVLRENVAALEAEVRLLRSQLQHPNRGDVRKLQSNMDES